MWHRVYRVKWTNVLEERIASIFRVEKSASEEPALAGSSSLYSSKIVDKKEILRTVSNTGIYCSSDEVGTVYPV
jgi:hypothetical protein